jgi:non-ribosomal peptide synthetase component F
VLKLEKIGRHDDFFVLGGQSLLAVNLLERMRRAELHTDIRTLFTVRTIAGLASVVNSAPSDQVEVPPNLIPDGCEQITPEMLPLVSLNVEQVAQIVVATPGGAANIQDIYPLAPLQEGILFHHLLGGDGDPYLLQNIFRVDSRLHVDEFVAALRMIVARHDILRTVFLWDGLPESVQVVLRDAPLVVEEVELDPVNGDAVEQLKERYDPRRYRLDVRQAPLMRVFIGHDIGTSTWILMILFHHLCGDQMTLHVVHHEVETYFNSRANTLPVPVPYRNFVAQARLGVSRDEHEAFFRGMLSDIKDTTAPLGLRGTQGDGSAPSETRRQLDPTFVRRLRESARNLGVSVASLCHVAWAKVLGTLAGRDDVVFGTVLLGRMQGGAGAEHAVGLLINTLPIRVYVGNAGAKETTLDTHALLTQLLRHEHTGLALAQRCSGVAPPAPLFSALLNYNHNLVHTDTESNATARQRHGVEQIKGGWRTSYPLIFSVDDMDDQVAISAQAQAPLDPAQVCAYMELALEGLVEALESAPQTPMQNIDILPLSEREQILRRWNATAMPYPSDRCLHELVENQAQQRPEAIAIVREGTVLTYGQLNAQANRLAWHLRRLGIGLGTRVALCFARSADLVIGLLAVLKAGGAYVTVDSGLPAELLSTILIDSDPMALLIDAAVPGDLRALLAEHFSGRVIDLDADARAWEQEPPEDLDRAGLSAKHIATVAYTHESTARPKGIMLSHEALCSKLYAMHEYLGIESEDRLLSLALKDPLALDICLAMVFGATIEVPALARPLDQTSVDSVVDNSALTVLCADSATWRSLFELGWTGRLGLKALCVGNELSPHVASHLVRYVDNLCVAYGHPEMGQWSIIRRWTKADDDTSSSSIGWPMANTAAYILDRHGQPMPTSAIGDLYIGGSGLALGYKGLPDVTAERFVPDPFGPDRTVRMFRTGDRAYYAADGAIVLANRFDERHTSMPLSETGDNEVGGDTRGASDAGDNGGSFEEPTTEMEVILAKAWGDVLKLDRIERRSDFFALGGHSLLAIVVLSRLRQTIGVEVALTDFFNNPRLCDLAQVLTGAAQSDLPPICRVERSSPLATSFAQQRLLFLAESPDASRAYNLSLRLRLRGSLDRRALQRALDSIVDRHEALRTTFAMANKDYVQCIAPESQFALTYVDISCHNDLEAEIVRIARDETLTTFDLKAGPLIRGQLIHVGDDDHVLLVTMHHIISDGWSFGILVGEFSVLYWAYTRGQANPLPPLTIQYPDYAAWQRHWLTGTVLESQTSYWRRVLTGAPALLALPTDRQRPSKQDHVGSSVDITLGLELTERLHELSHRSGTTVFTTLLAGWAILLSRLSGQDDITIGVPNANRDQQESEWIVGLFVNTLAMRIDLSGSPTVTELLQRVKLVVLDAQEHRFLPFEQVVGIVNPSRSAGYSPIFQTMFAWQNFPLATTTLPGLMISALPIPTDTTQLDLSLDLQEIDGCIVGRLIYATALFDERSAVLFRNYLERILSAMTAE